MGSRGPVEQASLTPLAEGHELVPAADGSGSMPFAADAPESTFSMSQLRVVELVEPVVDEAPVQPVISALPSAREIRAGRAVASSRAPVAEVRIPIEELESGTLVADAARHARGAESPLMPCMDQLVERVRQRTAARLSRGSSR